MIICDHVTKRKIQFHYDVATLFYRLLWGTHIHHGLWENDEMPQAAQVRLIERLACAAGIEPYSRVLSVGCGVGGTAIHLASKLHCHVVGLTLSPVQRSWARLAANFHGVGRLNRFLCRDAERATFPPRSFDVVWSCECTEHLFDKPAFVRRAASWLRPGGRLAIYAWLAGDEPLTPQASRQAHEVCDRFLCPSLGTANEYINWMETAGLKMTWHADFTDKVTRTWEICEQRVRRFGLPMIARLAGSGMARFVEGFAVILQAFRSGAMKYGGFVAQLPT